MKPISIPFIILAVAVAIFVLLRSGDEKPEEVVNGAVREHQELIFMLQYIGRDYRYAVENGSIINEFEYREMRIFCDRVIEIYLAFQQDLKQSETVFQLQQLRQMVFQKSDRYSIAELAKTLANELGNELRVNPTPAAVPDLNRGKRLYKAGGCNVCHGATGAGDGWAAGWLEPVPGSFQDEETMRGATPYQFFNVTQLGVTGTSMPSYEEAFTRQEVWDIAFYLMTLRNGFNPQQPGVDLDLTFKDLATKSDEDLLQEIAERAESRDEAEISGAIDYLRSNPGVVQR